MEIISIILYLLIGCLVGGLAVLMFDTRYFGRRLKRALDTESQLKSELSELVRRLALVNGSVELVDPAPEPVERDLEERLKTPLPLEENRPTEAEWEMMRDNLTRVSNHVEALRADKHALQVQLAAAEARAQATQEELIALRGNNKELQERNELLHHQLGAAEVEIRYLRKDMKEAMSRLGSVDSEEGTAGIEPPAERDDLEDGELPLVDELFLPSAPETERAEAGPGSISASVDSGQSEILKTDQAVSETTSHKKGIEADSQVYEVRGIGPVFARRLNDAGINNVADLAAQTPEHLSEVVGLKSPTHNRPAAWIAQAQAATGISTALGSPSAVDDSQPSTDPSPNVR